MQEINKENMIMKPKKQLIETAVKDGSIDRMICSSQPRIC